jgi:5-formyltetrahydrofolate cyclo-ligase
MMNKPELRKMMRSLRRNLDQAYRLTAQTQITTLFNTHPMFLNAKTIACYLASGHELDIASIIQNSWRLNKQCYLPVISDHLDVALSFYLHNEQSILSLNKFNIYEPKRTTGQCISIEKLDIILLPLLAFDSRGYRLGSGGGYYDRSLCSIQNKQHRPLLVGIGFSEQEIAVVPNDSWDVRMDAVLTEKGLVRFS